MDTKVYENFSVIWTLEELQLSDVEFYEQAEAEEKKPAESDRPAGTAGFSMAAKSVPVTEQTAEADAPAGSGAAVDAQSGNEGAAAGEANVAESGAERSEADTAAEAENAQAAGEQKAKGARIVMGPGVKRAEEEAKAKARAREEEAARAKAEEDKRREEILNKHVPMSIIVTVNGEQIKLTGKKNYVFVDVFEYIDFDLSKPQGSGIVTNLNGREAQYMESIRSGDVIEIYWKK